MRWRWKTVGLVLILLIGISVSVLRGAYRTEQSLDTIIDQVGRTIRAIETHYPDAQDVNPYIKGAISVMLQNLDPHSSFFDEKAYARMMEEQRGSFYGIGVGVQLINGLLTVMAPIPGTPAARAGLRAGDIIAEINGEPTEGQPMEDLLSKLRGPKGTKVTLTILRQGYDHPFQVTLIRDEIPLTTVPYAFMVNDTVGYLRIKSFAERTYDEVVKGLEKLRAQGMTALILDLRANTGGLLEQAVKVIDLFLPPDTLIVTVRGRGLSRPIDYRSQQEDPYERMPLVVLVDRGTASASEILAGAIQDHDRGMIVGQPTWGKGLVQTLFPLSFKTAVAVTTARYYTPTGRLIQRSYASYFAYLFPEVPPRPSQRADHPQYHTDLGRAVSGGGGIQPDLITKDLEWPEIIQQLSSRLAFFEYTKLYAPAEAQAEEQSFHSQRILLSRDFEVDDRMIEHFKRFLHERGIPFDEAAFEREKEWLRRVLKKELLDALWGEEEGYRYIIQFYPQFQRALEVIPQAEQLWTRWLRIHNVWKPG